MHASLTLVVAITICRTGGCASECSEAPATHDAEANGGVAM